MNLTNLYSLRIIFYKNLWQSWQVISMGSIKTSPDLIRGSSKAKLTRSASTPSPLSCDLQLTGQDTFQINNYKHNYSGVSVSVKNKLENSKSLPSSADPSERTPNRKGNYLHKIFLVSLKNSFRGFVLLDRQGMFRLSDEWRQWLSQVSENLILFIPIINIIIIFFSIILPLCDQVAIRVPSTTLQNQTHQEFTFSSRGLLRYHR